MQDFGKQKIEIKVKLEATEKISKISKEEEKWVENGKKGIKI